MSTIYIQPDCFVGNPLEFMNWRLLLARAAGYGVHGWEHDGVTYLLPDIDYENLSTENTVGVWDIEPVDVLLVLLAHSDEEGAIYPVHLPDLAERLDELLPDLPTFSQYAEESPAQMAEVLTTQRFIDGIRTAIAEDRALTFQCEEEADL